MSLIAARESILRLARTRVFYNPSKPSAVQPPAGVAKTTGTTGPWDKAGSTRIVHLTDGTTVRETVTSATAPDYFAYRLTEFSSPMIRGLVKEARGQWWFTDSGSGLKAKWTYTAESKHFLGALLLIPVIKILWNRYMKAAMKVTKERAETEVARGAR